MMEQRRSLRNFLIWSITATPVSNDATVAAETELKAVMEELQRAMVDNDDTSVVPLCKKAEAILAERNRLCKLNK